jgi:hypothetical protein
VFTARSTTHGPYDGSVSEATVERMEAAVVDADTRVRFVEDEG